MRSFFKAAVISSAVFSSTLGFATDASASLLPYATPGSINATTYTFTAASTGAVNGYYVGATAGYNSVVGLRVNGVLTAQGYGLDNFLSSQGTSFFFGNVTAGDTLTFELSVFNPLTYMVSSDATLNAVIDGGTSLNHIYSTIYDGSEAFIGVPLGTYIGFEDLPGGGDLDYDDLQFVFTNVATNRVPEPSTVALIAIALLSMFGFGMMRHRADA